VHPPFFYLSDWTKRKKRKKRKDKKIQKKRQKSLRRRRRRRLSIGFVRAREKRGREKACVCVFGGAVVSRRGCHK